MKNAFYGKSGIIRLAVLLGLLVWGLNPIFSETTEIHSFGDNRFGGYADVEYEVKIGDESFKTYIDINPEMGAKLFGHKIAVTSAQFMVGNFGNFDARVEG